MGINYSLIMQTIAVLLTCHNRKEKTISCLKAVFSQKQIIRSELNVFLVDDGSTDGTKEEIIRFFPEVHIIQGDGNLFWNRGMYTAWKEASSKYDYNYYLWLNDDTYLFSDAVNIILESSKELYDRAIICGAISSVDGTKITYGGRNSKGIVPLTGKIQPCDFTNGNVVLIPKFVYKKIGILDPYYHHSLGDFDYSRQAKKHGIELFQSYKIVGQCDSNNSILQRHSLIKRFKLLYSPIGGKPYEYFYFYRKHHSLISAIFHYIYIHLTTLLKSKV